jgi:hypothetical protein
VLSTIQLLRVAHKPHVIHHSHHKHVMVGHHVELFGALIIVAKGSAR